MPTFGIISGRWHFDNKEVHVVRIIGAAEFLDLLDETLMPFFDTSFKPATNEELACIKKLNMEINKDLIVEWIKDWTWDTPERCKEALGLVQFNVPEKANEEVNEDIAEEVHTHTHTAEKDLTLGIISGMFRLNDEEHDIRIIGAGEFFDLLADIGGGRRPPCMQFFDTGFKSATNEELACTKKLDMETNKHLIVDWIKEWTWDTLGWISNDGWSESSLVMADIRKEALELVLFNEEDKDKDKDEMDEDDKQFMQDMDDFLNNSGVYALNGDEVAEEAPEKANEEVNEEAQNRSKPHFIQSSLYHWRDYIPRHPDIPIPTEDED